MLKRPAAHRWTFAGLGCAASLLMVSVAAAIPTVEEANRLSERAIENIRRDTFESRRAAMVDLERATLLAPDSVGFHIELARLYYRMGFLGRSRERYRKIESLRPDLAEGHFGQGLAWRRDYLKYLDRGSLRRALGDFAQAAAREPAWCDAWLELVPLLVEDQRLPEALTAAERALAADPERAEALLAVAEASYRMGRIERADSAFRAVLPRLPAVARDKFDDIAPVASERDTAALNPLPAEEQVVWKARFWRENDPDLVTLENEAQLEYWARVAQAYFLYFHPRREEWDLRGEIYVRYGPPRRAEYNPVGASRSLTTSGYGSFPANVLAWSYPELGMTVVLQDRLLSEYYLPPISLTHSTDPAPHPDSLARRSGSLATAGGRGVFPMLPPGTRPLAVDAVLARFRGSGQSRLLSWMETPGSPGDSLWGEWVVLDSTRREVARERRLLSASACDPSAVRAADFASELPPGEYIAGLSVRGSGGRRGVFRQGVRIGAAAPDLQLSDVVVSCGSMDAAVGGGDQPAVRLSARAGARVVGAEPLTVYFETYNLQADGGGMARFEVEYVVRSAESDPRFWIQRLLSPRPSVPVISATRREEQVGALRRQFVSVPVQELPPGRYRIEIRVRDLQAGTEAMRTAEFRREAAG